MKIELPEDKMLIQFDGLCILCSKTIQFILKADKEKKFIFQTLQDSPSKELFDTVILFGPNTTYKYFDAILKIGSELGGLYKTVAIFKLIPRKWRHSIYLWIAKNRFGWFGVRKSCYLPSLEERVRFI